MPPSSHTDDPPVEGEVDALLRLGPSQGGTSTWERRRRSISVRRRMFGRGRLPRIGRFEIIRRIGVGGMGEVYLCNDEQLGRRVAVKRVRGRGDRARRGLDREARALARLSHPNVVQVYEVGAHEGEPFVAMEYIEGQTLGAWLDRGRDWMAILDHFIAAGHGLAAAHDEGLVHRDFKPSNVLIRRDGVVKVADFGLALAIEHRHEGEGRLEGTEPYMAPEQLRGESCDARSDQFAFCLVLHEAIWGTSPFASPRARERLAEIERGELRVVSGHGSLVRVVRRGLEADPTRRWPSMHELLEGLERVRRGPERRRRTMAMSVVGLGLALGLVWGATRLAEPPLSCEAGLDGIWDIDARRRLADEVEGLAGGHVADSHERIEQALDAWAHSWQREHDQVCAELERERDRLRHEHALAHSECLVRQANEVATLLDEIVEGDAESLAHAVVAARQLPQPRACAEAAAVDRLASVPPGVDLQVGGLRLVLTRARVLRALGHWQAAKDLVVQVDRLADSLGYAPLEAEAAAELAMIEDVSGSALRAAELYEAAVLEAEVARHDELVATLLLELADLSLHELADDSAGALLDLAQARYARIGRQDDALRGRLDFGRGRLAEREGDYAAAREFFVRAIELSEPGAPELGEYLDALAAVSVDLERELELRREALDHARRQFGPRHPRTARLLYNLGARLSLAGRGGQAELHEAAAIWTETMPASHWWRAKAEHCLAGEALARGDLDGAEDHAQRMRTILARSLAPEHREHGQARLVLARIAAVRADTDPRETTRHRLEAVEHAHAALLALGRGPRVRDPTRSASPPSSCLAISCSR